MMSGLPDYANLPGGCHCPGGAGPDQGLDPRGSHRRSTRCGRGPADRDAWLLDDQLHHPRADVRSGHRRHHRGRRHPRRRRGRPHADGALLPGDQNDMPDPSTHGYVDPAGAADLQQLAGVDVEPTAPTPPTGRCRGAEPEAAPYTTIADLFQWASTGSGNTLLSSALGDHAFPPRTGFIPDAAAFYGLGLTRCWPPWIGHSGQAIGWEVATRSTTPKLAVPSPSSSNSTGGLSAVPRGLRLRLRTRVTQASAILRRLQLTTEHLDTTGAHHDQPRRAHHVGTDDRIRHIRHADDDRPDLRTDPTRLDQVQLRRHP